MKNGFIKFNLLILIFNLLSFSRSNIIFSKDSGFYSEEFLLTLHTSYENSKIYYTLDGNDPTNSTFAKEYNEPILIKDRTDEPNIYSNYEEDKNSSVSISLNLNYKKPSFLVDKAMVVRAVLKYYNNTYDKIIDKTYFITTQELSKYEQYTVISLVTNPENFFGPDKGIYVTGSSFIPNKDNYCINCNYINRGKEWERESHITIFEKGVVSIDENVGVRIKGASSRNFPQKSFNIYFRKIYGKKNIISDSLLPENVDINGNKINKYDAFSLKGVSDETTFRDKFSNKLIHGRKLLSSSDMKSTVLFLNGEFWGMYIINEKFSEKFFQSHYNIPKEDIVLIKNYKIESGTDDDLTNIINFMTLYSQKDLSDLKNYNDVCDIIDIESMIEHYAAGIYLGTVDWPNLNFGIWKNKGNKIENNLYSDGKWRFITFDLDYSIIYDYEQFVTNDEGYKFDKFEELKNFKEYPPTSLFISLFKNEDFKKKFINIYEEYVNDIMSMDRVKPILEEYYREDVNLAYLSKARWKGSNASKIENIQMTKNYFQNRIMPQIKKFFENRPKIALEQMEEFLKQF